MIPPPEGAAPTHDQPRRTKGAKKPRMRGGLRQRAPGSWEFYILVPDPLTGKKKQRWHTAKGTHDEVADIRVKRQADALNRPVRDPKRTVAEQWKLWLAGPCRAKNGRAELQRKETIGRLHVLPTLGNHRLGEVTAEEIQSLLMKLLDGTAPRQATRLSATSVNGVYRILRTFFRHARANTLISRSPLDDGAVSPPGMVVYVGEYWTAEQAKVALAAMRGEPVYMLVRVALYTGLRLGEIMALSAENVDCDRMFIQVDWAVDRAGRPYRIKGPKSKSGRRTIPIGKHLASDLRPIVQMALTRPAITSPIGTPLHLLFGRSDGSIRIGDWASKAFCHWARRSAADLGLPVIRFHDLRDSFAIMLMERDVSLKVISTLLGHASIVITEQRYARVTARMVRRTIDAAAAVLGELDTDEELPS